MLLLAEWTADDIVKVVGAIGAVVASVGTIVTAVLAYLAKQSAKLACESSKEGVDLTKAQNVVLNEHSINQGTATMLPTDGQKP